jgi:hypothetical protein
MVRRSEELFLKILDHDIARRSDRELARHREFIEDQKETMQLYNAQGTGDGYSPKTLEAIDAALERIAGEETARKELTKCAKMFAKGQRLRMTAPQRGWNPATCAEPQVGLICTFVAPAPKPGMSVVCVDLRDLGYEDWDGENFKDFYFYNATLEPADD